MFIILGILHTRLAITSIPFLDQVTSPHLQVELRGLDAAMLQAMQVVHTALHYTHTLMTTFGLIHTLDPSPEQFDATSFLDHQTFVSPIPDSRPLTDRRPRRLAGLEGVPDPAPHRLAEGPDPS